MLEPKISEIVFYCEDTESDFESLLMCCDSASAILTDDQLAEWLIEFRTHANAPEAPQYCDFFTATAAFDIEGHQLVCVIDSGGEVTSGYFQVFCEDRSISVQTIVDTLDFTGAEVSEMYTGTYNNYPDILSLVNKISN